VRVLIVDDNDEFRADVIRDITRKTSYEVVGEASTAEQALDMVAMHRPDLVLMDAEMVEHDPVHTTAVIRKMFPAVQVMGLGAVATRASDMIEAGACGFLLKGSNYHLLLNMEMENRVTQERLEGLVRNRSSELWNLLGKLERAEVEIARSREETVARLASVAELHDDETHQHVQRMSRYAALLADKIGLDPKRSEEIRVASMLHDIGKIGVPDEVVMKPGRYDEAEFEAMKRHCEIGFKILSGSEGEPLETAAVIALTHHERWDGSGYPHNLKGEDIPLEGRIAAIADVFDSLTTDRIWRKAHPFGAVLEMMKAKRGTHFDPDLLDLFMRSLGIVLSIKEQYSETKTSEEEQAAIDDVDLVGSHS
jgi:putative two-component system response regulator